ncbi:acyl-homoserine-lactone synthase [Sphingobium sp.]|uniref:acyl-homoserine-lactone synthase n=1 Tax=Sphingobium sp. TaxID=1912891 RepID=UPI0028BD70FC|nr:acyl-homoserine-lactone synthase [Sphingobium sp.]
MIHLISKNNCALYPDEIRDLHQARAEVFVNQLGWDLRVRDGLEHDEYDDERASNIIGFSTENRVVMGLRFRPTDDCSMLLDHFSHVLPAGIRPIDDGRTWELSRGFCIERGMRRHNLRRKAACMIAPLELAHEAGIDRCVGFTDVRMLSFCYGVGWKLTLLGSAMDYGQGEAVAYEVDVSKAALTEMRQMWGLPKPSHITIADLLPGEKSVHCAAARLALENPELQKIAAQPEIGSVTHPPATTGADVYYGRFGTTRQAAGGQ